MARGGGRPVGVKNGYKAKRKQTSSQKKKQAERCAETKQKNKKKKEQQKAAVERAARMNFFAPRTNRSSGDSTAAPINNDTTTTAAAAAVNTSADDRADAAAEENSTTTAVTAVDNNSATPDYDVVTINNPEINNVIDPANAIAELDYSEEEATKKHSDDFEDDTIPGIQQRYVAAVSDAAFKSTDDKRNPPSKLTLSNSASTLLRRLLRDSHSIYCLPHL